MIIRSKCFIYQHRVILNNSDLRTWQQKLRSLKTTEQVATRDVMRWLEDSGQYVLFRGASIVCHVAQWTMYGPGSRVVSRSEQDGFNPHIVPRTVHSLTCNMPKAYLIPNDLYMCSLHFVLCSVSLLRVFYVFCVLRVFHMFCVPCVVLCVLSVLFVILCFMCSVCAPCSVYSVCCVCSQCSACSVCFMCSVCSAEVDKRFSLTVDVHLAVLRVANVVLLRHDDVLDVLHGQVVAERVVQQSLQLLHRQLLHVTLGELTVAHADPQTHM